MTIKQPDITLGTETEIRPLTKRQKIIGALSGIALVAAITGGILLEKSRNDNSAPTPEYTPQNDNYSVAEGDNGSKPDKKADVYIDPNTGDKVVDVPGKTPEDTHGHNITMLGMDRLIDDYGMTLDQVKSLQGEFEEYSSLREKPFHELSMAVKEVKTTVDSEEGTVKLEFPITLDRSEKETARVEYFGIGDPNLTVYDAKHHVVYESIPKEKN